MAAVLKRACEFLGKSYSQEELQRLEQHLSFEVMKSKSKSLFKKLKNKPHFIMYDPLFLPFS